MKLTLLLLLQLVVVGAWGAGHCDFHESSLQELSNLDKHFNGQWWSADSNHIRNAPCKTKAPPSEKEMIDEVTKNLSPNKKNDSISGINFKNEDPKLLRLFAKLHKQDEYDRTEKIEFRSKCDKVICALKEIYGPVEGVQLLYILDKYGINGSDKGYRNVSAWKASELNDALIAFADYPTTFFPIEEGKKFVHFKRGYTRVGGQGTLANAVIEVFDNWNELGPEERQSTLLHELGHNLGNIKNKDRSPEWLNLSQWKKKTVIDGKTETTSWMLGNKKSPTSRYGATNPAEDFAETVVAYRYNGILLKKENPEKFNYMKSKVFDGIDYTSVNNCIQGTETQKRVAKLNKIAEAIPKTILNDPKSLSDNKAVINDLFTACQKTMITALGSTSGATETCIRQKITGVYLANTSENKGFVDQKDLDSKDLIAIKFSNSSIQAVTESVRLKLAKDIAEDFGSPTDSEISVKKVLGVSNASSQFCEEANQYMYQRLEKNSKFSKLKKEDSPFLFFDNRKNIESWARGVCSATSSGSKFSIHGYSRENRALEKAILESLP